MTPASPFSGIYPFTNQLGKKRSSERIDYPDDADKS